MEIVGDRYALLPNEKPREGGMAVVRRAIDIQRGGKPVALKLFSADIESSPPHLEAYSREAGALQRLSHDHIVAILDGGRDSSGRRFLVLEWLEYTLRQHLERQPLSGWDDFYIRIGNPVLSALTYAFSRNTIHRDLKPPNILFTDAGVLKITDFGLSKLRSFISPHVTVAGWRSEPYVPPEPDDSLNSDTRDVYAFAVLCIALLSPHSITTYEDVYRELNDFKGPNDVADVLERALSREPTTRPPNIVELAAELSQLQAKRVKALRAPADLRLCHVSFADGVLHKVRAGSNVKEPRQVILDDLNDCCGLKWSATGNATKDDTLELLLFSAQYFFKARVDPLSHSYLHIHNATPLPPSWLEVQREGAWSPVVRWTELQGSLPPPTGHDTIDWLLRGLAEYEATLSESRRLSRSDALFRNWLNILAAKTDIEQGRQAPISYDGVKALGSSRLELSLAVPPEAEIVGQPRMVELAAFETISGEVESIGVDTLIFFVNEGAVGDFPRRGKLLFDTRAERRAIQLQRQAVDAVRFRRAVRTDLGDLLVSPGEIKPPGDAGDVTFIDGQLDASKQLAVRKALAAESFLVVEGPPGTGKTRFIAELVLQTLKREPAARILLTSQTHVALDHALQKLRDTRPELRLVRIGRRGDDKISAEVSELLLENKVDAWLLDVRKRSQLFVKAYAKRIGADEDEVRLGMAVARLRNALDRISRLERERQTTLAVVQELRSEQAARAEVDTDERFNEVNQSLRDSVTTARTLELELTRAGVEVAEARSALKLVPGLGAEISDLTAMELAEWEDAFLRGNDATRRLHRILMLAEEWYLRFGRSRDFFGALISESQVIAGTCLGFAGVRGMQHLHFDLCIVDEASKATVTELLVPISRSRRWVLVGDRQQLPPFVESAIDDPAIREAHGVTKSDLETTLLTTLAESLPPECVTRLVQQHRMVHQIGDLISHCFYEGSLLSVRKGEADALAPALPRPVTWFSTSHESDRNERKDGSSYKNVAEARTVAWLLKQLNFLARWKRRRLSIAVLTGYGAQRRELQRGIDALYSSLDYVTVECNTVDAFQGREANIAIYSVTRSNEQDDVGFLRERRRINVALSRAQDGLAIVGDAHFIRNAGGLNPLGRVLTYMEAHQLDCFVQEAAA